MTHIKKLFLTLSLLTMQSTFCMEQQTKKHRTDDEWTLIKREQDLKPWTNKFAMLPRSGGPTPYFIRQFQPIDEDRAECTIYTAIACIGTDDLLSHRVAKHHWRVRGLKRAELSLVMLGSQINYNDDQGQPMVPNQIRLDSLMPREQTQWIVDDHLKFPVALLAMKKFRHSALDPVPKDVVRLICKFKIADVRRENPVLRSVE
jgi:hypothetical protein